MLDMIANIYYMENNAAIEADGTILSCTLILPAKLGNIRLKGFPIHYVINIC